MLTIRPFDDDDIAHLGDVHAPSRSGSRRSRTFVADRDGVVAGAATLVWSSRHPDFVAATIDVDERSRRRGVGTELLRHLHETSECPVMFNVERSAESSAFLAAAGFEVAVTSVTIRVSAREVIQSLDDSFGSPPDDVRCSAMSELSASAVEWYDESYAERHRWAGRYTPPPGAPWIDSAGPPLEVPGAISVAEIGGEVIGVASLHSGPFADGADAFLAPTSILVGALGERTAILARLLGGVFRSGVDAGIRNVNVEYDTSYDDLAALAERWTSSDRVVRDAWLRR